MRCTPTTDHDALPRSAQQRRGDHHFLVITAIESDEAGLDADTVLLESDQTRSIASLTGFGSQGPGTRYGSRPMTRTRGGNDVTTAHYGDPRSLSQPIHMCSTTGAGGDTSAHA